MSEEKIITEEQLHNNPDLATVLCFFLVKINLPLEFPEFMVAIVEENFLRGYKTGLDDAYGTNNTDNEREASENS